jgi:signal transduction histidine kinase
VRLYQNQQDGKDWFMGEVEDTGMGIPQEKLGNLFTEFYQVDSSMSRKYEGTGMGLALTMHLVELHHGTITAKSEDGKGGAFLFSFSIEFFYA